MNLTCRDPIDRASVFDAIAKRVNEHGTFARILRPPVDGRIVKGEDGLDVGEKVNVKLLSADTSNGYIDFQANT